MKTRALKLGVLSGSMFVSLAVFAVVGQRYNTEGEARYAALQEEATKTAMEGDGVVEYGAAIYRTSDGGFVYTNIVPGGHTDINIPIDHNAGTLVSLTHSHPYDAVDG